MSEDPTGGGGPVAGDPACWPGWYRAMFETSPVAMALADERGLLVLANEGYCRLLGRSLDALVGHSSAEFTHADDLDQHAAMDRLMAVAWAQGGTVRVEKRYLRPDGETRWGWVSVATVHGPQGQAWTMAVVHDVTERRELEDGLLTEANTDVLTGLLNRRGWLEQLEHLLGRVDRGTPVVLAMLDLDRFKAYNDTHGHPAGDALLVELAVALAREIREQHLLARWGGEELVLALPGCDLTAAARVLARLAPLVPAGQTFSAGYDVLAPAETVDECLARVDEYLYEAKRTGRARAVTGSTPRPRI